MVSLTIDNKKIEVPDGTTVLRAAESAGIHIPTLCDHPKLTPYGGCRLCLVEVEGARTLQPSCTLPAGNNMIVHTDTAKVKEARTFVLTMIFSERNHFCPYCQVSGGDCELQNSAYAEGMTHWPLQPNFKTYPVDASHPYFILEHNRCILCRRCVRACGELVGNFTLGFEERGALSFLVADLGTPLGESSCISCGVCVQICPTGALIDRWSAYRGHDEEVDHTQSICVGCSVGCGIDAKYRDNMILRVDGDWDSPICDGILCKVGRFYPMIEERQRILTPLIRKDGALKASTWEEAVSMVVEKMNSEKNKANMVAVASTRLSAEALYTFKQLFVEGMKSKSVTSTEEGQYTALPSKYAAMTQKTFEGNLEMLKSADCITVIGEDLVDEHEVIGFYVKRSLAKGAKLVVVDTNENKLDVLANATVKPKKGSYLEVLNGLAAATVKLGLAKGATSIQPDSTLAIACEKTNISSEDYMTAAYMMASAKNPVIIIGKGLTSKETTLSMIALMDLGVITGAITSNYSGVINVKGLANSLAAAQYQLDTPLQANGSQFAYIALGDEDPSHKLIQSVEKVPYKVVQATYSSKLTATADVVLPVGMWAEQEGHYINLEGKVQKAVKVLNAPENIRSNVALLVEIANKLNIIVKDDWNEQLTNCQSTVTITAI